MKQSSKRLLNILYSQCDDLALYSRHLTASQCDAAFRCVRDIVLFINSGSDNEREYDVAEWASTHLNELVNIAKRWIR